jgi:hypothetical protein
MPTDRFEPDAAEDFLVQGELYSPTTVPVEICGPVETREVASRNSSLRGVTLGTTTAIKIAGHDGRRKGLRVWAYDSAGSATAVQLGNSKNEAEGAYGAVLPLLKTGTVSASTVLPLNSITELWALAVTGGCVLSIASESWI